MSIDLPFLKRMLPEVIVVLTALGALAADLAWWQRLETRLRLTLAAWVTSLGCLAAWAVLEGPVEMGNWSDGMWVSDKTGVLVKQVLLLLAVATAWIQRESPFTKHIGEYAALMLFATLGGMTLVSTRNLLGIFLGLELLSLSLYCMAALDRSRAAATEAALKYFLVGSIAAAFLLFGFSLFYGLTGHLNLEKVAQGLAGKLTEPLAVVALVMVVAGLGFKIAAVPFHLWAPDVYEGAPTPAAAFVAASSKVASFYILTRIVLGGWTEIGGSVQWGAFHSGWKPLLGVLAAGSMILGNLVALRQTQIKRLLAYSAIAHAGYVLVGLLAGGAVGSASVIYYAAIYGITSLGAFAVVAVLEKDEPDSHGTEMGVLAGLWERSPVVALCFAVFVLSLAGIPPMAGFAGKFYLMLAGVKGGGVWVVWVALLSSAVALYYYLKLLKQVFVLSPAGMASNVEFHGGLVKPLRAGFMVRLVLILLALAVLFLGCFPHTFLKHL